MLVLNNRHDHDDTLIRIENGIYIAKKVGAQKLKKFIKLHISLQRLENNLSKNQYLAIYDGRNNCTKWNKKGLKELRTSKYDEQSILSYQAYNII